MDLTRKAPKSHIIAGTMIRWDQTPSRVGQYRNRANMTESKLKVGRRNSIGTPSGDFLSLESDCYGLSVRGAQCRIHLVENGWQIGYLGLEPDIGRGVKTG
jgi:hypothetical protein